MARIAAGKRANGHPVRKARTYTNGYTGKGALLNGSRAGGKRIRAGRRSGRAPGTR